MEKRFKNLMIFTLIMVFIAGISLGYVLNNQSSCKKNPYTFSVEKLEELNEVDFICSCTPTDYSLETFYFDDEGLYKENPFNQFLPTT